MNMKRSVLFLAAVLAVTLASGQIPKPGWVLSDMLERQSGVVNYTNEKFDFGRFPSHRRIGDVFDLGDTTVYKQYMYGATVRDKTGAEVATVRFQDQRQIFRQDTAVFISVHNPFLEISASCYLAPDASDDAIRRAADSLASLREYPAESHLLPAGQDAVSYALQYLFARSGYATEPLFGPRTYFVSGNGMRMIEYCCDRVGKMKIGSDIERFVRKARFAEDCIYVCEPSAEGRSPIVFFWCDGKFWAKIGMCQYMSWESVESVWRHDKRMPRIHAYRLKERWTK